jgi:N-acetyl-gamma-glutamyl-phosphate/LysW-gamma-L-alpha-aminoadipyl-6-phosphate reductase
MIKVSIVGASGYAGGELLRLLLNHPEVSVIQATSQRFSGEPVALAHPNLRGQTNLSFSPIEELKSCDVLLIALPNDQSTSLMPGFKKIAPKIIDLGSDFRLSDKSVYGLAELNREKIVKAKLVSGGGCEATAIILALYPLIKEKLIDESGIIADVKIGSSAAGNKPSGSSHHPERQGVLRSYKPTGHRHQLEVANQLGVDISMSATAVNLVRGILATIHTNLRKGLSEKEVWQAYRKTYQKEPFIRLVKQGRGLYRYPEPKLLWGTNFCDIGFEKDSNSNRLVVLSAIDNLVKGTAGQAVQALNLMSGFEETTGLNFPGLHPV